MLRITPHTRARGLSYVEAVVVVALFAVLMFAVVQSIAYFYRFNSYAISQSYQVSYAERGLDRLVRDIREMTFADDGTYPLAEMNDYDISFYSDIDRDQSVEYVEYTLATTTLYKYVYNATGSPPVYDTATPDETEVLSEYVQNEVEGNPIFRYYMENGAPRTSTTTITDIRYIETSLIVNVDQPRNPGQFELRSSAAPRNLKETY